MNVVYRGVPNPPLSFPGIPANKVTASTPGLKKGKTVIERGRKRKLSGPSDYELDLSRLPPELRGKNTLDISVTGELPSGERVSSKVRFRIKALPTPFGSLDGRNPDVVTKADLKNSTITASFGEDFDFNLNLELNNLKLMLVVHL